MSFYDNDFFKNDFFKNKTFDKLPSGNLSRVKHKPKKRKKKAD